MHIQQFLERNRAPIWYEVDDMENLGILLDSCSLVFAAQIHSKKGICPDDGQLITQHQRPWWCIYMWIGPSTQPCTNGFLASKLVLNSFYCQS